MERTYVLAGVGERVFGFVHRTFMEYFAACCCLAEFNARKSDFDWLINEVYAPHWDDPAWVEVLLLLIAMLHDQGTPIGDVIDYLWRGLVTERPYNVAFAARCLGETGETKDQAMAQDLLASLAQIIARYAARPRTADARQLVETGLVAFGVLAPLVTETSSAVGDAIAFLSDSRRSEAAGRMVGWQMGFDLRLRKERLGGALEALKDPLESVRRGAIGALEREWPGRADLAPILAVVAMSDRNSKVRQDALAAVQRSWRHEPAILDVIDARVGEKAGYKDIERLVHYLGATWPGNDRALRIMVKVIEYGYKLVERSRLDLSAQFATAATASLLQGWPGDTVTTTFIRDHVVTGATGAEEAEYSAGYSDPLPFIRRLAVSNQGPSMRAAVLEAVVDNSRWANDPELAEFVRQGAMYDPDAGVRAAVLTRITRNWERFSSNVHTLIRDRAINDSDSSVRSEILKTMDEVAIDETRAFVRSRAANDPDPVVRRDTLRVFRRGSRTADDIRLVVDQASNDPDAAVRAVALATLAGWWHQVTSNVRDFIRARLLTESAASVRSAALTSFHLPYYRRAASDVVSLLEDRAVHDPDASVREAVLS